MTITAAARRRRPRWGRTALPACVAALVLLLAACSASDDGAASSAEGGAAPQPVPSQAEGPGPAAGDETDVSAALEPRRIRRGQVTVRVEDLLVATQQVRDVAAGLQGYVSQESISLSEVPVGDQVAAGVADGGFDGPTLDDGDPLRAGPGEGRLVLRVPPERMEEAMNRIGDVGQELTRWQGETDVELTLVDLESRIATQTRSVADIRALMDRATSLADIVMLEAEVNARTQELESLKARQESVAGDAAMATVTAVLRTPSAEDSERATTGFLGGLRSGLTALQASVTVLMTVTGALLPFAAVGLLVGYPAYRLLRRRWAARPARAPQQQPEPPPPPERG